MPMAAVTVGHQPDLVAGPIDAAREALLERLTLRPSIQATSALDAVGRYLGLDEMAVRRAFWQLLGEGKVVLDGRYRLRLAAETSRERRGLGLGSGG
jgi:hypothetical protein